MNISSGFNVANHLIAKPILKGIHTMMKMKIVLILTVSVFWRRRREVELFPVVEVLQSGVWWMVVSNLLTIISIFLNQSLTISRHLGDFLSLR